MSGLSAPIQSKVASSSATNKTVVMPGEQISITPIDVENSVVIGRSDYHAMEYIAGNQSKNAVENERKAKLKAASKARYEKWPNTLEAMRIKKGTDRMKRLEAIELAQQEIDRQEAAFQQQQTQDALNKANRLLFTNNDQVKVLHSALLMSNILQERDEQMQMSNYKKAQELHIDKLYQQSVEEANLKQAQREKAEEDKRKQEAIVNAKQQLGLIQAHRAQFLEQRREEIDEGIVLLSFPDKCIGILFYLK
jgi:hypothetical protein